MLIVDKKKWSKTKTELLPNKCRYIVKIVSNSSDTDYTQVCHHKNEYNKYKISKTLQTLSFNIILSVQNVLTRFK